MKKFVAALIMTFGLVTGVFAQDKSNEFIRFNTDNPNNGGLQIAVTDYVSPIHTGIVITLVGAVHVGDKAYYDQTQKTLDSFDVVLYEGVKKGSSVNTETKVLHTVQTLMADGLGLKFQMDSIDYKKPNLVHADITMDDLEEKMNGEHLTPFGPYIKEDQFDRFKPLIDMGAGLFKQIMDAQPELQNSLKAQFGQQMASADISTQLSPNLFKAIVLDRNKIVMEKLGDQLANHPEHKTVAVFYGAGHYETMQADLKAIGFTMRSKKWVTAWGVKPVEESEEDK